MNGVENETVVPTGRETEAISDRVPVKLRVERVDWESLEPNVEGG